MKKVISMMAIVAFLFAANVTAQENPKKEAQKKECCKGKKSCSKDKKSSEMEKKMDDKK